MKILSNSLVTNVRYLLIDTSIKSSLTCPICGILKVDDHKSWEYVCWTCCSYLNRGFQERGEQGGLYKIMMWVDSNVKSAVSREVGIPEDFPSISRRELA